METAQLGQQEGRAESTFSHKTHHRLPPDLRSTRRQFTFTRKEKQAATVTVTRNNSIRFRLRELQIFEVSHVENTKTALCEMFKNKRNEKMSKQNKLDYRKN